MDKQSWKRRAISPDRIGEVLRTSRTMTEAARTLGVNRSTLHRWLEDDPSLMKARKDQAAPAEQAIADADVKEPDAWFDAVTSGYTGLSVTDRVVLDLARRALEIARDSEKITDRLAAMGRFQRLVNDVEFRGAPEGGSLPEPNQRHRPPHRTGADPRESIRVVDFRSGKTKH